MEFSRFINYSAICKSVPSRPTSKEHAKARSGRNANGKPEDEVNSGARIVGKHVIASTALGISNWIGVVQADSELCGNDGAVQLPSRTDAVSVGATSVTEQVTSTVVKISSTHVSTRQHFTSFSLLLALFFGGLLHS